MRGHYPQDKNENSSDEEDKNSDSSQSTEVEEEHPRQDNGYSLERESPFHQNQAEMREEEGENVNEEAQQTTDQECGPRATICGLASQLPYHSSAVSQNQPERYAQQATAGQIRSENLVANSERARAQPQMAEKQTGQENSNGGDNSQLNQNTTACVRHVKAHPEINDVILVKFAKWYIKIPWFQGQSMFKVFATFASKSRKQTLSREYPNIEVADVATVYHKTKGSSEKIMADRRENNSFNELPNIGFPQDQISSLELGEHRERVSTEEMRPRQAQAYYSYLLELLFTNNEMGGSAMR
ncbi:unnamed protein product [Porites lobata]|uniref:Uncharacterized protein n=1 Tax=Porites lobata TaxID=104759 RepID=A0ABN8Q545_9CNID|nr:unnamed protein product [Porites lobata]